jgi:hypothetical protein
MKTIKLFAVVAIAIAGCGDNKTAPDARVKDATPPMDAYCSNCPAAPTLGAQIDRMGRAAVNTVLTRGFDPTAAANDVKKAYNENSDFMTWFAPATIGEFAKNLALIDALDSTTTTNGCGNQALFTPDGDGNPTQMSYVTLASVLANDQLFVDTSKPTCTNYLAVEFGIVAGAYSTCGGRAPEYDVVDFSYSMLAAGVAGFTVAGSVFTPKIGDGVAAHDDYLDEFPYLGPPN